MRYRGWRLVGAVALSILCIAGQAAAEPEDKPDDEVIVTGTRLRRSENTTYPTATITALDIERRGLSNALDAVRTNPVTGLGASPAGTQASLGVGSAFVDLFDLGSQRTLTLIDGRRVVGGNQATLFGQASTGLQVDLNIVPTALIERIDIVSVGGAPSYGADAIGGTVNVVLKRDFEGTELDSQYGAYGGGFGDSWRVRALHGGNFDEGRGNVTLAVEHAEIEGFSYEKGPWLSRLPALAPNPLNAGPFTTQPEPNGIFNNILLEDFRTPSMTSGGAILRAPFLPTYLTEAGRRYLLENPDIAASHPEFALLNNSVLTTALISRVATDAEIAAGARPSEQSGGEARVAVPLLFRPDGTIGAMDLGRIAADQPLSGVMGFGGDGFSIMPFSSLQSTLDRTMASLRASYRFDPTARLSLDVYHAHVEAIEPVNQPAYNAATFGGANGVLGFRTDNPFLTDQARAILTDQDYNLVAATPINARWNSFSAVGAVGGCRVVGMPVDILAACPDPASGTRVFYTSRALDDLTGNTPSRTDTDTTNVVVGLDGDMPWLASGWVYDASASYGRAYAVNRNVSILQAQFNAARDAVRSGDAIVCRVNTTDAAQREAARFAYRYTNVVPRAGSVAIDPSSPEPRSGFYRRVVGDPLGASEASLNACAPLNLFGQGAPSDAARTYVVAPLITSNRNEQFVAEFNISGPLAHLWAGDLDLAAGVSWRQEGTTFKAENGAAHYGLARAVAYGDIVDRSFTSLEYYAETTLPLVGAGDGIPLVRAFALNASLRAIDNDFAGRDKAWTYGFAWTVLDGLTLRGGRTRSVRAPSLTELYLPPSGTLQAATDPCDTRFIMAGPSPAVREANCAAAAAALGFSGLPSYRADIVSSPSQGQLNGNPDLRNETATSQTLGILVRTDDLIGEMSLALDYVDIEVTHAIESLSLTKIMEACYDNPVFPNPFCARFVRLGGGSFRAFQVDFGSASSPGFLTTYVNVGRRDFSGITATAGWTLDLDDAARRLDLGPDAIGLGLLDLRLVYSYIDELKVDITGTGQNIDIQHGEIGRPRNEHQLTVTYLNGPLTLVGIWAHQGAAVFDAQAIPENREQVGVGEYDIYHANLLYDLDERVQARLTVNNVFDEPPPYGSGSLAYDQVGRFFQAGLKVRF